MSTRERRERDRAARRAAILRAARELAESEGWSAVTTRRLADRIEFSQPVLYSHFRDKDAIVTAVAREGIVELACEARARAASATDAREALEAVATGYLAFARRQPATYSAMFTVPVDLRFAADDTPAELHEGFASLRDPLVAATHTDHVDLRTELFWSTLHGLATLAATGRIPVETEQARVSLLIGSLAG